MSAFVLPTPLTTCTTFRTDIASTTVFPSFVRSNVCTSSSRRARLVTSPTMSVADNSNRPPLVVMVNGLPGKMAAATADEVVARGLTLAPHSLTGPDMETTTHTTTSPSPVSVTLHSPEAHAATLQALRDQHPRLIAVDYTHPSAANRNVDLYTTHNIPFVLGTTGGDTSAMHTRVNNSSIRAVIAPNMAKQIVAFQAMMSFLSTEFPGAFDGYSLSVKESHQSTKADTSGTAKAVVASFAQMGLDFSVGDIEKVRDPQRSITEMKVPEHAVSAGHAYHTYDLISSDGTVNIQFQHNVTGRGVYASGTVDAVQFLDRRLVKANDENDKQRIFSMIDVLRSGSMS